MPIEKKEGVVSGIDSNDYISTEPTVYPGDEESNLKWYMRNLCTRQGWIGEYDFGFLCLPNLPGLLKQAPAKFIGIKDRLPLAVAIIMGFQHCLAMLAGVVTPPLILSGPGPQHMNLNTEYRSYLISASHHLRFTLDDPDDSMENPRNSLLHGNWTHHRCWHLVHHYACG
ncbi:hypothetical protein K7432_003493 [Basidiobolus ranarum]|uniref:Uncharacterized protein n=1 Tax=Basidiobolus ranarum TaxID=34480 RepID=A0ABR2WZS7_9FUNG